MARRRSLASAGARVLSRRHLLVHGQACRGGTGASHCDIRGVDPKEPPASYRVGLGCNFAVQYLPHS